MHIKYKSPMVLGALLSLSLVPLSSVSYALASSEAQEEKANVATEKVPSLPTLSSSEVTGSELPKTSVASSELTSPTEEQISSDDKTKESIPKTTEVTSTTEQKRLRPSKKMRNLQLLLLKKEWNQVLKRQI